MLLLFSDRNRFPSTCNPSWGCTLLVVDHGVVFQLVEHLFDSWGCDNHWWDNHWWDNHRWDSLSYLLLEIPINFATVHLPEIFSGYSGIFPSAPKIFSGYFRTIPTHLSLDNFRTISRKQFFPVFSPTWVPYPTQLKQRTFT